MKKVLIITYYWPPSGGAGVQRWLKFVKYLREFGWEPIVYTPENPEAPDIDNSLEKDIPDNLTVIKRKIWEPYTAYKKFIGQEKEQKINAGFLSENKKPKLSENISVWIRGNFFIPDARKFWIKPSVKFLTNYLKNNPVDAMISSGPPHSMHMIALGLKQRLGIPWLADFRDPWTNIDFYDDLKLSKYADKKHHALEQKVLKNADSVVLVSNGMADDFNKIYHRNYEVITNGYDSDDISNGSKIELDKKFSISYIGTMVKTRNPISFWKAINQIINLNKEFAKNIEIKLIGKIDYSVQQSIEEFQLQKYITKINYLPHNEVIKLQKQSQVLLLLINNTPNAKMILTGKFFEYMASHRPILCIGPSNGDAVRILKETNSGLQSDFQDVKKIKENILNFYQLYKNQELSSDIKNIENYSRKGLTNRLVNVLNGIA
ncbi:MAG: glycosyltransferase family 4 protein [Bacteroidales bacterium]|nr:glycosyltransferase family 4 protein [Bacteroidales bacterium]